MPLRKRYLFNIIINFISFLPILLAFLSLPPDSLIKPFMAFVIAVGISVQAYYITSAITNNSFSKRIISVVAFTVSALLLTAIQKQPSFSNLYAEAANYLSKSNVIVIFLIICAIVSLAVCFYFRINDPTFKINDFGLVFSVCFIVTFFLLLIILGLYYLTINHVAPSIALGGALILLAFSVNYLYLRFSRVTRTYKAIYWFTLKSLCSVAIIRVLSLLFLSIPIIIIVGIDARLYILAVLVFYIVLELFVINSHLTNIRRTISYIGEEQAEFQIRM